MVGRLAFLHNYEKFYDKISKDLNEISDGQNPVNVYVTGSLCGGTGSGISPEMGYFIKKRNEDKQCKIFGIFTIPPWTLENEVLKKNAFYALSEINHYMSNKEKWEQSVPNFKLKDEDRPYEICYLSRPKDYSSSAVIENEKHIAEFLLLACMHPDDLNSHNVDKVQASLASDNQFGNLVPKFSSFGIASIEYPSSHIARVCSKKLAINIMDEWLSEYTGDFDNIQESIFSQKIGQYTFFYENSYPGKLSDDFAINWKTANKNNIKDFILEAKNNSREEAKENISYDKWKKEFIINFKSRITSQINKYLCDKSGIDITQRILAYTENILDLIDGTSLWRNTASTDLKTLRIKVEDTSKNLDKATEAYIEESGKFLFKSKEKILEAQKEIDKFLKQYIEHCIKMKAAMSLNDLLEKDDSFRRTIAVFRVFIQSCSRRLSSLNSAIKKQRDMFRNEYDEYSSVKFGDEYIINGDAEDEARVLYADIYYPELVSEFMEEIKTKICPDFLQETGNSSLDLKEDSGKQHEYILNFINSISRKNESKFKNEISKKRNLKVLLDNSGASSKAIDEMEKKAVPSIKCDKAPIQRFKTIGESSGTRDKIGFAPDGIDMPNLNRTPFKDDNKLTIVNLYHGYSLAHMKGIMKNSENDSENLEYFLKCSNFTYWNTRQDVKWANITMSQDDISRTELFWMAFRIAGLPKKWYSIEKGKVKIQLVNYTTGTPGGKTICVSQNFNDAINDILHNESDRISVENTAKSRLNSMFREEGDEAVIKFMNSRLSNFEQDYSNIGKTMDEAKLLLIKYYRHNNKEKAYYRVEFPENTIVDPRKFDALLDNGHYRCPECSQQFVPDGMMASNISIQDPDTVQNIFRFMIKNSFICQYCNKNYWPRG